jgi:site-specific recombinase XerD
MGDVSKANVLNLLHGFEARGSSTAANRALAYLSKFFNWCIEKDYPMANPITRVKPLTPYRSRNRVLKPEEATWIWKALENAAARQLPTS